MENGDNHSELSQRPVAKGADRSRYIIEQNVLDSLVLRGCITQAAVEAAMEGAKGGEDLEAILLDHYDVPREAVGTALSEYYQCPYLPYDERTVLDAELFKTLNIDYLKRNLWLPIARRGTLIDILTTDPNDSEKNWDIRRAFSGVSIRYSVGLRRDIEQFLSVVARPAKNTLLGEILSELVQDIPVIQPLEAPASVVDENDSAIVRLANHMILEADRLGASDLHIEPYADRKDTIVRYRVDGSCFTHMKIPAAYRRAIVSRLKIMANLDIAERRKPQDGKISFKLSTSRNMELRVATLPTAGGDEDVVLRLLTAKEPMSLHAMEFSSATLEAMKGLSEKPHGLLLCVGPTGSGKTTTLHALLRHINTDERKIWTAEDPIEITQDGLRQVQVHHKIGLTFSTAMRAFLRADPDVIMIGEMRDKETADIAIEASLTGHLVLSTLHTNSAVETVVRLLDLGCDSFNFADSLLGILAQRLCKKICSECREAYCPSRQEWDELAQGYGGRVLAELDVADPRSVNLHRGRGCPACNRTGFKGRVAIHECLVVSEQLKKLIQSKAPASEILGVATREGMETLLQNGITKVLRGLTVYAQVRAVAMQ
jgi:type II secretory ATPase GspE/PulE/Tfp pilus assembly ATPase PilB-like protein